MDIFRSQAQLKAPNTKKYTTLILMGLALLTTFSAHANSYEKSIIEVALHSKPLVKAELTDIEGSVVKMATFTTYNGYKLEDEKFAVDVWTTIAPELKTMCTQYKNDNPTIDNKALSIWIAKLLGLPEENAEKRKFIEMDVTVIQAYYGQEPSKIGIFRPCTDPRINKHEDGSPRCPLTMDPNNSDISTDYKTWFINNSISSHKLDKGFPWTEYGYTYNWNTESSQKMGLSEFVVLKNTPLKVLPNPANQATPYFTAEEYCS